MKRLNEIIFPRWLSFEWWKYILSPRQKYRYGGFYSDASWLDVVICRIKGHPHGCFWYNPNGLEPDYHCKDCGEEI